MIQIIMSDFQRVVDGKLYLIRGATDGSEIQRRHEAALSGVIDAMKIIGLKLYDKKRVVITD